MYGQIRRINGLLFVACLLLLGACASPAATAAKTGASADFVLSSTAFNNGGKIPDKYTANGAGVSPPLTWSQPSQGTQSLALITEDMDGPSGIITHWIIFNIPASSRQLAEAIPAQAQLSDGSIQGKNFRGASGYMGPAPPTGRGMHRYVFTLFALSQSLTASAGDNRTAFLTAIQGHILGVAPLVGTFER